MKILFIEDDDDKANRITESIQSDFPAVEVVRARSFNTGLRALISGASSFALVLLDMTMPTYDVTPAEIGSGGVEYFAGRDMLAQMELRKLTIPTAVVTMFDSFGEGTKKVSLGALIEELRATFAPTFVGHVYYNSTQDDWRSALKQMIIEHAQTRN